jgi:prephenate dehydrogenase
MCDIMVKIVAIIGVGKMGLWFCRYFSKKHNYKVLLYDRRKIKLDSNKYHNRVTICKAFQTCIEKADIVVVCVPIKLTIPVINKCVSGMKNDACIVEIASLKSDIFSYLLKIPDHIIPISIHPMFGPGLKNLRDTKMLVIPIRNQKREENLVKSLFSETRTIVIKDPQTHDAIMAILLGLIYYTNLLLVSTLSNENITLLKRVSGTTFYLQKLLFESILTDHSSLITSLLADNKQLVRHLKKYNLESAKLFGMISNNKKLLEKKINQIKKDYSNKRDIRASYENMYSIISKMNNE